MRSLACLLLSLAPLLAAPERQLLIAVAADAPEAVRQAADEVWAAVEAQPLLRVMAAGRPPAGVTDSLALAAARPEARAYAHLVLVGLPTDPLIAAAWQREARVVDGGLYVFGFGHLAGDLGYVESDRNPFLHSRHIPTAPFETECVTLTGTTPAGIVAAVRAFLEWGLINGVVAREGWRRTAPSLLARELLPPTYPPPAWLPERVGGSQRIGWTAAGEDEYRGVLHDTGVLPREIWRAKYWRPGVWDGAGAAAAYDAYSFGLHRRAYGNTVWLARFTDVDEAGRAAPAIARAAKLRPAGDRWRGEQPPYGFHSEPAGPLALRQRGEWLVLTTLPAPDADALFGALGP